MHLNSVGVPEDVVFIGGGRIRTVFPRAIIVTLVKVYYANIHWQVDNNLVDGIVAPKRLPWNLAIV